MYIIHKGVSESTADEFLKLALELNYKFSIGSRMRLGKNAPHVESKYWYTRWFDWNFKQRSLFKELFPEEFTTRILQAWFLKYEPLTGLSDEMDFWLDHRNPATFYCLALHDGQTIVINGETVVVNKGEILEFTTNQLHEVRPSKNERHWACIMTRKSLS